MRREKLPSLLFLLTGIFAVQTFGEETAVVTEGKVNVRGKPSFVGEVITQLERGDKVTVLERINLEKARPDEPTNWAKIKLPENTPVWVFAPFIKEGKVSATRLNLRAGAGENYSVIGRLDRGDAVKTIRTVEEWMEIEAPKDAYAFIDLSLVKFDSDTNVPPATVGSAKQPDLASTTNAQPAATVSNPPATAGNDNSIAANTEPAPAIQATTPPKVSAPEEKPVDTQPGPSTTNILADVSARSTTPPAEQQRAPEPLPPVAQPIPPRRAEPPTKRIVRREGLIRATKSIQAPTWYELVNADSGKTINYLYDQKFSENAGIKLKDYRGKKVVVTGEEAIDSRWPNTPILDLQTLDVVP